MTRATSCLVCIALAAEAHAGGAAPAVDLVAPGPVVGDGESVSVLELRISDVEAKRALVRAVRGKVLSVSPVRQGIAEVRYRAPRVAKATKIVFVVTAQVGRKRLKRKVALVVVPAAPAPEVASAPAATEPEPAAAVPAPLELPPPPDLSASYRAVALLPLTALETGPELLARTEAELLRAIDEVDGHRSVSARDLESALVDYGLNHECGGDLGCMARAGRYGRAHLAVDAAAAVIGGTLHVSLRLVDTGTAEELTRVADVVSDNDEERAAEMRRLLVQLLTPEAYVGSLQIACAQPGAEIYIDDQLVGHAPLPGPLAGLRAGPHILRVSLPGFTTVHRFVDVVYMRSAAVQIDLENNTVAAVIQEEDVGSGLLFVAAELEGVEIHIDGKERASTFLSAPIEEVRAGTRRLTLHAQDMPVATAAVEIAADRRTDVLVSVVDGRFDLRVLAAVDPTQPLPGAPMNRRPVAGANWRFIGGAASAGIGVASLAAAGYFANRVDQNSSRARELYALTRAPDLDYASYLRYERELGRLDAETPGLVRLQWAAFGVGAGLTAVGGALLGWDLLTAGDDPGLELTAHPGGIQVRARW